MQIVRSEGGYEVRGKKNYLPPAMLVLGYGVLWTTEDEETMLRHKRPLLTDSPAADEQTPIEEEVAEGEEDEQNAEAEDSDKEDEVMAVDDSITKGDEDKYNLEQYGSASEDNISDQSTAPAESSSKPRLSAKQRRDLKKGKSLNTPADSDSEVDEVASSIDTLNLPKTKAQPKVRGKKGKLKKMKAKYADQSDEERELARKLLGAKTEKAEEPATATPPPEVKPIQRSEPKLRLPPVPKPIIDEPLEDLDLSLDGFIAAPKPGDVISDAVTVCAPWSALTRSKYKVKLTPGATKKGKAARAIISGFLTTPVDDRGDDAEKMSREKELLKSLRGMCLADLADLQMRRLFRASGQKVSKSRVAKSMRARGPQKKDQPREKRKSRFYQPTDKLPIVRETQRHD